MTSSKKKQNSSKPKIEISRRETSGKKKPDLFAKFRNTEHPLDGIVPDYRDVSEKLEAAREPESFQPEAAPEIVTPTENKAIDSLTSQSTHTSQTRHTRQTDIAPSRNFQKVPNSITKSAIPDGLFKPGKSKHLYDIVYSLTRGAIEPKRVIRMSKTKLRKLAGIGSRITFDSCVNHLEIVGLLKVTVHIGEHEGNEFEVFLPEEITMPSHTSQPSHSSQTRHAQNLDTLVSLESSQTSHSSEPIYTGLSDTPKTSYKTNTIDDEALAIFTAKIVAAAHKLTGKGLSKREADKWGDLADLLILELEVAAARAGGVSSVPAFLTEVLRRQFFAARQQQKLVTKTSKAKPDTVGKSDSESFEIKALDTQGRELALEDLKEFTGESFLDDFKKWYTDEDWQWLTEKLKESGSKERQSNDDLSPDLVR